MIYFHRLAIARAFSHLFSKPLSSLLSALVIAIALTLPALGYVLINNLASLAKDVSGKPEISIFLKNGTTPEQAQTVEALIKKDKRIASYRYIPRDEALKQLSARGGFADVTTMLDNNPLPDAFVLEPKGNDPVVFDALRNTLQNQPEVAHVQLDSVWVERLHALVQLGQSAVLMLAALLGAALVIVTFNTIRLQILTQRHEISVSLLLGATRQFVRRPFLYFGFLQGLLGGLFAWGLALVLLQIIGPRIQVLAQTYNISFAMSGSTTMETGILLVSAALLGWLGAALSVIRHLHDKPVM